MKTKIQLPFKIYEKSFALIVILLLALLIVYFINTYSNIIEGITVNADQEKNNENTKNRVESDNKQKEAKHKSSNQDEKNKKMINNIE
jgi:Na+-transporting methylmalonyl-CoA/oxaloacetate decarboxylase gamma subunit